MGFMDDLSNLLGKLDNAASRSLYDPQPSLEVDGIVTETNIPEDEVSFKNPGQLAYAHNDQARDPGVSEHVVSPNAVEPGGDFESNREEPKKVRSSRDDPEWSVDAPADLLSTAQYSIGLNPVKVREENPFRMSMTIQNLSGTAQVSFAPNAGGTATGGVIPANQSAVIPYKGEIWLVASAANTIISVIELARKP